MSAGSLYEMDVDYARERDQTVTYTTDNTTDIFTQQEIKRKMNMDQVSIVINPSNPFRDMIDAWSIKMRQYFEGNKKSQSEKKMLPKDLLVYLQKDDKSEIKKKVDDIVDAKLSGSSSRRRDVTTTSLNIAAGDPVTMAYTMGSYFLSNKNV